MLLQVIESMAIVAVWHLSRGYVNDNNRRHYSREANDTATQV